MTEDNKNVDYDCAIEILKYLKGMLLINSMPNVEINLCEKEKQIKCDNTLLFTIQALTKLKEFEKKLAQVICDDINVRGIIRDFTNRTPRQLAQAIATSDIWKE